MYRAILEPSVIHHNQLKSSNFAHLPNQNHVTAVVVVVVGWSFLYPRFVGQFRNFIPPPTSEAQLGEQETCVCVFGVVSECVLVSYLFPVVPSTTSGKAPSVTLRLEL